MTADTFAAGLRRVGAPSVVKATATPVEGVFLVRFEHRLSAVQAARLQQAGFVFRRHAYEPNFYQMRWTKPGV